MKTSQFNLLLTLILFFLLLLQGMWLFNTYQLQLEETKADANRLFHEALLNDMEERFKTMEVNEYEKFLRGEGVENGFTFEFDEEDFPVEYQNQWENQVFYITQYILHFREYYMQLSHVDSLYQNLLHENEIYTESGLMALDSLGVVQHYAGAELQDGFLTDRVYLTENRYIQAAVMLPPSYFIRNMAGASGLSLFVVVLIVLLLIYEMRMFRQQYEINQLRESFTHSLTHDMKTPLGTIYTVLDQLHKGRLKAHPQMLEQFTAVAMQETNNLQAGINRILTVSTIDGKQIELNRHALDIVPLVEELKRSFLIKGDKQITIRTSFGHDDALVWADSFYLTNVVSNLLDNAIKYSTEPIEIDIITYTDAAYLFLTIRDNGTGISTKDQQRIFNRFERGTESKQRMARGFGLGLTYVKQVTEAHGGKVTLKSRPGEGSEFTLSLPKA